MELTFFGTTLHIIDIFEWVISTCQCQKYTLENTPKQTLFGVLTFDIFKDSLAWVTDVFQCQVTSVLLHMTTMVARCDMKPVLPKS